LVGLATAASCQPAPPGSVQPYEFAAQRPPSSALDYQDSWSEIGPNKPETGTTFR
jgi:hypothetical protein